MVLVANQSWKERACWEVLVANQSWNERAWWAVLVANQSLNERAAVHAGKGIMERQHVLRIPTESQAFTVTIKQK